MKPSNSLREAIVSLHKKGKSIPEIAKILSSNCVTYKSVYNTVKRFKETGKTCDRPRSGRPTSVITKNCIKRVRELVRRNPRRSMRQMAKNESMSHTSMQKLCKLSLGLRPFKKVKGQLLSESSRDKRMKRCRILLRDMRSRKEVPTMFSDEKLFMIEAIHNTQNDRVLARTLKDIPDVHRIVTRRQKPPSVMVWAAVMSDGKKMPLIFVEEGLKVNKDVYLNMLQSQVLPWFQNEYRNKPYVFTQDGAPAHTARIVQQWCTENFSGFWSKDMWPPSSPDINPLDFSLWSILEAKACSKIHHNIEALKSSLVKAWDEISQDTIRAICSQVPHRMRQIVARKGGHFEKC